MNAALDEARTLAASHETRLRAILAAAEVGTFDFAPDTGVLIWDDKCRQLFGLPPGAKVTYEDAFLAGLHPDDREMADRAVLEALAADGTGQFDIEYRTIGLNDGIERWVSAKGRSSRTIRGRELFGIVRDVTRKRRAEIAYRDAAERYRLVARATNDVIWDWDLVSDEVLWNDAITASFGYPPAEIDTTGDWWLEHIHPEDRERVGDGIHDVIDGDGERWSDEYRFRRQDGSYAAVHDRGYILRDEKGKALRMVGAMLDLSERKRAEEQQQLLLNELQHRVKNTLAMIQAIANQTFRDAATPEARDAFSRRVIALSRANDLLTQTGWTAAPIEDIVVGATIPHCGSASRFTIGGPAVEISAPAALSLTLALHELCTNASKYGAFSNDAGRVAATWSVDETGTFTFEWAERGGPPVTRPERTGFGSRLIHRSLSAQLNGEARTDYDPGGITFTLKAPLSMVREVPRP